MNNITSIMNVKENKVKVMRINNEDYISLTDLARYKNSENPGDVIIKWMSNKSSFSYTILIPWKVNKNFLSSLKMRAEMMHGEHNLLKIIPLFIKAINFTLQF